MIGVSPATLDRLEADDPTVDVDSVGRAAEKLGLKLDYGRRMIEPPANLPPPAPPRRGMAGKRLLALPPDVYDDLVALAAVEKQSDPIAYLRWHIDGRRHLIVQAVEERKSGALSAASATRKSKGAAHADARH